MTSAELLELFNRAVDGDVAAQAELAAVVPSLDPVDVEWLHMLSHLHADLDGLGLDCGHE
ncbi:MAG: hypothetical protein Q8K58_11205 [Acidimicrobiales bacterium]|nr:hypothetical protein [Acidimicrobiales bacterium]